jgi:amino acid permease
MGSVIYCLCVSIGEMIAFLYVRCQTKFSIIHEHVSRPNVGGVVGLADM